MRRENVNADPKVENLGDARERREERKLRDALHHPSTVDWDEYDIETSPHHLTKQQRLSRK